MATSKRFVKLLRLIDKHIHRLGDDSYAITFQTLGQYRNALLKELVLDLEKLNQEGGTE